VAYQHFEAIAFYYSRKNIKQMIYSGVHAIKEAFQFAKRH
jgi:hypothetical protein